MGRNIIRRIGVGLCLTSVVACDLEVTNSNSPDRERALAEASDVEQLIAGSFNSWWRGQAGPWGSNLSQVAFQHSGWQGNNGQTWFSAIPREPLENDVTGRNAPERGEVWVASYRAIFAVRDGLAAVDGGVNLGVNEPRARAFGRFVQGLAHGSLALMYDQAFIIDETVDDPASERDPQPYTAVFDKAIQYLDEAIAIAQGNTFAIPETWMSIGASNERLVAIAHAFKARFRTQVARSPEERANVDWLAVVQDLDRGITDDFIIDVAGAFSGHIPLQRAVLPRWAQLFNFYRGMADQSGAYQTWINTPLEQREPFIYVTPDMRFPQGTTLEEQIANPGRYITYPGAAGTPSILANQWLGSAGKWRWSYYRDYRHDAWLDRGSTGPAVELSQRELRLLRAEALLRAGDQVGAAAIIDETRTTNGGLGPALQNADCVPRLPNGSCGDLMETLKWEQRLETYAMGFGKAYFEARGWGDLPAGTFIHLPIPGGDLFLLELPVYTFGGAGNPGSAPPGTYGF